MNNKQNYHELTKKFFDSMNSKEFDEIRSIIHEDICFDFQGTNLLKGQKIVIIFLNALTRKYKKLTFTISEIIVENNNAIAIWTNNGQTINGDDYSNRGVTHIRFREDKIEFLSDYFKDTSFTQG
ncbi:MAG: nuclear transport factor 2 family protein [Marinilabiliales bacterium]|nr:MAG: nuclear transport factor 2 family protein [Marinilabiliales bacterium]